MVEPTESEDKDELDRFCDALIGATWNSIVPCVHAGNTAQLSCSSREQEANTSARTRKLICFQTFLTSFTKNVNTACVYAGHYISEHASYDDIFTQCTHTRRHACTHTCMRACARTHKHTHMHVCTHTHTHARMHVCTHTQMCSSFLFQICQLSVSFSLP